MSIQIKIAFCTECNGYHSATTSDRKYNNHSDIIDHFFYHGEPFFTFDHSTFEKAAKLENTEILTMSLDEHVKQDHLYCYCKKKKNVTTKKKSTYESVDSAYQSVTNEKYSDTDYYFKDLYHTYNNFHGASQQNNKNYNSNRK
jgi:hypothetical protein